MPDFYPDLRNIGRFRFALVDASLRDGIPAGVQQEVIAPAFLGEDTDRCPTLIALDSMPSSSRVAWCDELHSEVINREESRASLLIESDSSLKALASHMARRMALQTPGRDRPLQWRYFDPGTALQMPRVLGHVGLAWLMAPAKAWMVPWAGSWQPIAGPNDASQQDLMRFKLQSEHIAALMRVSVINRTLLQNDKPLTAQEWVDGSQQLDAIVVQGQTQHKLDHRDDLVAYAFHAWTKHLRIHEHPHMQGLLRELQQATPDDEIDYRELTASITQQDWARMAAELEHTT
ncbi:MAG: DUF4123 domain-containing protein [Aquabacterium sp.]|jgi:hypothetical protein|nr:DUF4123 domain-containing protein [Aquabacterium sp.]